MKVKPQVPVSMTVEDWPLDRIIPYEKNPRLRGKKAVGKVASSIRQFGVRQPIVVDEDGIILVGHTRRDAAKQLGMITFPVHQALGLSEAQKKAYRIADNRTNEETSWDDELLKFEFGELRALDFDLALTGFDAMNVDSYLHGVVPDWNGMPEFHQDDLLAWQTLKVHFKDIEAREAFSRLIGQTLTDKTKYVWHPQQAPESTIDERFSDEPDASGVRDIEGALGISAD